MNRIVLMHDLYLGAVIRCTCPFCGNPSDITLDNDQYARYKRWDAGEGLVQNMLPELSTDDKERLISGICNKCWSGMFGDDNND